MGCVTVEATVVGVPERNLTGEIACDRKVNLYGLIHQCPEHGAEPALLVERLDDLHLGLPKWCVVIDDELVPTDQLEPAVRAGIRRAMERCLVNRWVG